MSRVVVLTIAVLLAGCSSVPREFHPEAPIAPEAFSHGEFDAVLRQWVDDGIVQYPAIRRDGRFDLYLSQLNRVDPRALPTRHAQLAYWINAYNAFAIKGIVDGLSPSTAWGRYRFFIGAAYEVGGERITLFDLEQRLLIPEYREPRIHFAIVCASQSCPKLRAEAYAPDRVDAQLEEQARQFVNDPSKNRFDRDRKVAHLSMIFQWFEEDFAAARGSLLAYVRHYVTDAALAKELEEQAYRVEFLDYDWSLNGVPPSGPER